MPPIFLRHFAARSCDSRPHLCRACRRLQPCWLDYSPRIFFSLDASYGSAFQEYWTLARAGYRLTPRLSLGIEGGALGKEEYDAGRGGAFTRIYFRKTEITVSGGCTGNYLEDEPSGYVSVGVYRAF